MYPERYVSPQVEDLEEEQVVDWMCRGELEVREHLEEEVELVVVMEVVGTLELEDMLITEKTTLIYRIKSFRSAKLVKMKFLKQNYLEMMASSDTI